jgi:PhnB protein
MTTASLNLLPHQEMMPEEIMEMDQDKFVQPYLFFDGNCREAFTFYHQILGGEEPLFMTYGEMPAGDGPKMPTEAILHARYLNGKLVILGSDCPPGTFFKPQGFALSLENGSISEAERVFTELSVGGEVTMPIAKTFWAERFGMLTDRFGIPWMVSFTEESAG